MNHPSSDFGDTERGRELFRRQYLQLCRDTDRVFVGLLLLQWFGAIVLALVVSPWTWIGETSQVHLHVWISVLLGAAINSLPLFLAFKYPGQPITRHFIAVSQMLWSALLIHLSGGRIETHFHVFGSLAFIAFYRDWRVLMTATIVVAGDHFVRGVWYPQSVFGVLIESPTRWIEHAGWVLFEDFFLIRSGIVGLRQIRENCERQALLESTNAELIQRTDELSETNGRLRTEIAEREHAENRIELSRQAGMAEVATGVLHNVGNVLNSVNVSANVLTEKLTDSGVKDLAKAAAIIDDHSGDLAAFMTSDERGKHFPDFLGAIAKYLMDERESACEELSRLVKNVQHIKEIVSVQQSYAKVSGSTETIVLSEVLEDALKTDEADLIGHNVEIVRDYEQLPMLTTDKHKLLQVLLNLISNAKQALVASSQEDKRLALHIGHADENCVRVEVRDNGVGIAEENLIKIFSHGFTTKKNGHGFGLHSSSLAAKEIGGLLTVHSDGPGQGAVFRLELPTTVREEALCTT